MLEYLARLDGERTPLRGSSFLTYARRAADLAGVPFPDRELSQEEQARAAASEVRRAILGVVIADAQERLWSPVGNAARSFLRDERQLSDEQIRELGIGLCGTYQETEKVLRVYGFAPQDIAHCNILRGSGGALFGYILFPWHDDRGRLLTLYGRWPGHPPSGKPKTTALAGEGTKRSPIYLDRALRAHHRHLVLVEGLIDAAVAQVHGDTRVVACVAAQLSEAQIATLVRQRIESVIICLDPDGAGDNGTASCVRRLDAAGIEAFVAPALPDNLDPDQFILSMGIEAWRTHLDAAEHGYRWYARQRNLNTYRGDGWTDQTRAQALATARAFAQRVPSGRAQQLSAFFWSAIEEEIGPLDVGPTEPPGESYEAADDDESKLIVRAFSDVESRPIDWLWRGWIGRGKVAIFAGVEGDGKSYVTTDIVARLSRGGRLPDGFVVPPCRVLMLIAEDGIEDTVKPRLERHMATMDNVRFVEAVREPGRANAMFSMSKHLPLLRDAIIKYGIDVVVVDPLSSFLQRSNRNDEGEIRDLLTPLSQLADETNVAILGLAHLNRPNGTNRRPTQRILGSTAFAAVARLVWILVPAGDERDETRRVLAVVKSNIGTKPRAQEWSLPYEDAPITWHGESSRDINELLNPSTRTGTSPERAEIVALIKGRQHAMTPEEIATALGKNASTIRNLLRKMHDDRQVTQPRYGHYGVDGVDGVDSVDSPPPTESMKSTESTESSSSGWEEGVI